MPNLLAMSFEGTLAPAFDLRCLDGGRAPDGWGIGFYPGEEPAATVIKEHAPPGQSLRQELVKAWQNLASSMFVVHLRKAQWGGLSDANTQPFLRSHAGRDWLFAHAGSLDSPLETNEAAAFEPVGTTDSERVFCHLMSLIAAEGWRRIADFDLDRVLAWLRALDGRGSLCLVWSDGLDLLAYADAQREGQLYLWPRFPPYNGLPFGDADLAVDLFRRGISSQRGLLICSEPLEQQGGGARWEAMAPGELVIAREGIIRLRMGGQASASSRPLFVPPAPTHVEPRTLRVDHQTIYTYAQPVERSMHVLRLTPFTDRLQRLLAHDLRVSVPGRWRDHDDVFGNRCRRILCEQPWQTLALESSALVEVLDTDPLLYRPLRARTRFPLVWMPWQHQALQAFLMPQELPESQLHALTDYAMSFVRRNDADLVDTLLDINWTIFKEYRYVQGTTTMHTSPWETFTDRLGVCQDFTQLFITLARLLGIPARYVCGYLYLGPDATNTAQAAATHAWVQLYLPELGWTGFDPTNGVMTSTDHVRLAVGRNALDTTPTSGTLYRGGGAEQLSVVVKVQLA
ncbi:MAG: class II glutamine amidotransferase [bacterium]